MKRTTRGLVLVDVLSMLLIVTAIALYLWPVRVTVPPAIAVAVSLAPPKIPAPLASGNEVTNIVTSNIMSASRRAPMVRYVSPDRAGPSEFTLPAEFMPVPDSASGDAEASESVPSLYGIVNIDGVTRALLRLTESDASPVLLGEGDKRGGYRVVAIHANTVIVAGSSGQRTLRLSKPVRNDSTGKPL